jgi:hypothetical protein
MTPLERQRRDPLVFEQSAQNETRWGGSLKAKGALRALGARAGSCPLPYLRIGNVPYLRISNLEPSSST